MISFDQLRQANEARVVLWHPDFRDPSSPAHWNGADWGNAMQGEAGEAGNIIKKIRRLETIKTGRQSERNDLVLIDKLGLELADTVIYADLAAAYYGLDLGIQVARKFNITSEEYGWPQRLP